MGLFIDDGSIKGGLDKEERENNSGIRNFVLNHIEDVVEILTTLKHTGMTINASKCNFGVSKVEIELEVFSIKKMKMEKEFHVGLSLIVSKNEREGTPK
ncbi:hypothetical protein AYI70_g9960 [Smittium culicis]|uniref:Reverse transcriptase domain-containing protein n=1 Tax=Smittium culicis TaxID=133412 RepID=A0A1R1X8R0_9FUNG|nr:hypothetical protein AYI70_g9960 [Smittium culicis]